MAEKTPEERQEQLRNSGSGTIRGYLAHRAKPYLPPWLLAGGVGVAGAGAHLAWADSTAAGVGLTLGSVALTAVTWAAGRSTGPQRRIHSTATVAAASGWLTAAALAGPLAGPLPDLYLMGAPALAISWNVRGMLRHNPEGAAVDADKGLLAKVGLARAQIKAAKAEPNRATAKLELPAGELSNDDVAKLLPKLASALDVAPNAVRYLPDPDSARRGELAVVPEDMLKHSHPWPGPSAPGASVAEPVVVGMYEHGEPLLMWFPGDPEAGRNAMHLMVMGMTGSGKSEGGLVALAELLSRRDVVVWASDAAKGTQTLGPLLPAIDWAALDVPSTEAMLAAVEAAIPARTSELARHGYKQWEPEAYERHGIPYLVVWVEEVAKVLREGADLTGIAQEARSAGISLVVSLQRASGYQMPTDTRASLGSSWCYGVRDSGDAGFALPDEALDAGAAPQAWKDKRPGYCYVCANGVPEREWATPARTYLSSVGQLEAVVAQFASIRAALDETTAAAAAAAAGTHYTGRQARETAPPVPAARRPVGARPEETGMDPEELELEELADSIDPEEELEPVEEVITLAARPEEPRRKLSPKQARAAMEELLAEFEAEGREVIGPKDFMEHCDRHRRSRGWVSGQVAAMVEEGRLAETAETGRYRIVRDALTPA